MQMFSSEEKSLGEFLESLILQVKRLWSEHRQPLLTADWLPRAEPNDSRTDGPSGAYTITSH
jgi:hypothetical protein